MFSVQYHPEASPGPMDSHYLFDRFARGRKAARIEMTPLKIDLITSTQKLATSGQDAWWRCSSTATRICCSSCRGDPGQPGAHKRDELYFIQSGHGIFKRGGETVRFNAGDVLFVPAGVPHRFASFSAEFKAWVMFFGPEGGVKTA